MNPEEVPQLIAQIALADPRVKRENEFERRAQVLMWAGILADVPYDYALQAAHEHYAQSVWPILPADIATRWTATVRDRMNRHTDPTPVTDPDDVAAWRSELLATRHAVATGQAAPAPLKELTAGPDAEVQERLDRLGRYVPAGTSEELSPYRPVRAERERLARAGEPDPLDVRCDWCRAPAGEPCRQGKNLARRRTPHPSRIDAAAARQNQEPTP
ncbi:zinc finger domain-containing protein [Streptomyces lydicus]|uniref:zinc finger domain-containing protein n=1 Tax=Streptomyces lydicus TaxID=47763 RepID=UPI00101260ED|nr:hypothetical protein [Streptomyces lydicus]MCZ1006369.1 hypothetical protein [Streptomyces lydicus]